MRYRDRFKKRSFDVIVSALGLLVLWPVIAITWAIARKDTKASGFFCQSRIGRYGKPFKVIKLRTMRAVDGTSVTTKNDTRITPWGAFFRKWKLDELPQLWNVLKGEMSFVGPRPDVPGYLDTLTGDQKRLQMLRPGVTGPATLKYRDEETILAEQADPITYNNTVIWPDKVKINLAYMDHWSFGLDFHYIWRTLKKGWVMLPNAELPFTPVVIIGAGRSGTNALRDMLTSLDGYATWKCDEIAPIWRHGNLFHPHDEFTAAQARPAVKNFIRHAFVKIWSSTKKPAVIVEKTCANSLRVPFIDAALPEAKYIYIVRNGLDVVASARKRWQGDLEVPGIPYFVSKIRYAPLQDLPLYGVSFLKSRIGLLFGKKRRLASWGPRFKGMKAMENPSLEQLCAAQWAACVEKSDAAFADMPESRVFRLSYEEFTQDPKATLAALTRFIGHEANEAQLTQAASIIRQSSVGKGQHLKSEVSPEILTILQPALQAHGYGT